MRDEQAFLDAIKASPADPGVRLVYADWLEEQGDTRCEFVRIQVRLAGLSPEAPEYRSVKRREWQLRTRCTAYWLGWLDQPPWWPTDHLREGPEAWLCPALGQVVAAGLCWECCMAGHGGPTDTAEWLSGWVAGSGRFPSLAEFQRVCASCAHCAWFGLEPEG